MYNIFKTNKQTNNFSIIWLPRWLSSKESACQPGDLGSIPGSEDPPGAGNGYPLQYSCLGNPTDRGAWRATVHGVAESGTTEWLSTAHGTGMLYWKSWSESPSVVSDSLWPHGLYSPWDSPGQNAGVGSLSLLQGIFPTQGSNPGLPNWGRILYQLSQLCWTYNQIRLMCGLSEQNLFVCRGLTVSFCSSFQVSWICPLYSTSLLFPWFNFL